MNAYQWKQAMFSHYDAPTPSDIHWIDRAEQPNRRANYNKRQHNNQRQYGRQSGQTSYR